MKNLRHIFIIPTAEGYVHALLEWLKSNKITYTVAVGSNIQRPIKNERKLLIIDDADRTNLGFLEEMANDEGIKDMVLLTHDKNFNVEDFNKYAFANLADFTRDLDKLLIRKLTKEELKTALAKYFIGGIDDVKPALEDDEVIGDAYRNGQKQDINDAFDEFVSEIKNLYGVGKKKEKEPLYNADFRKYYDSSLKRNVWVLGYFGGGSVNIIDAYRVACDYSNATGVPLGEVKFDEILKSRRFKGFKFVYSTTEQKPEPDAEVMENVYQWLND